MQNDLNKCEYRKDMELYRIKSEIEYYNVKPYY